MQRANMVIMPFQEVINTKNNDNLVRLYLFLYLK